LTLKHGIKSNMHLEQLRIIKCMPCFQQYTTDTTVLTAISQICWVCKWFLKGMIGNPEVDTA